MEPLTVVCWKWRARGYRFAFTAEHVNTLQRMVARHYDRPHRFICITDDPAGIACETLPLWSDYAGAQNPSGPQFPSCFRRLKLFASEMREILGPRVVSLDLDVTIVGDLCPLWERDEPFTGWAVAGTHHPRVFNGSMWMVKPGALDFVWRAFDPLRSPYAANKAGFLGSDQGWMSYILGPARPGWTEEDGVYSYSRSIRKRPGKSLPPGARVIVHHGKWKPWLAEARREAPWIKDHYR